MDVCGAKNGNMYTISIEASRVASILVESQNSCHRKLYQRGPVLAGLTINPKIFEEALLAVCQKDLQKWSTTFNLLAHDTEYGRETIQKIFQRQFIA